MNILTRASRIVYGVMMIGLALQQIFYAEFRPVIVPAIQHFPGYVFLVYLLSVFLIISGLSVIVEKYARSISIVTGGLLLLLILFTQVPYELFIDPYNAHLGSWAFALKELAFCGSAFTVADTFNKADEQLKGGNFIMNLLEKMIPLGSVFFAVMLVCFGISHFLYVQFIQVLVPNWIPGHVFWTYLAGAALAASGIAIILRVQVKLSALLLASIIFLWFIFLHIPRAIAAPYTDKGNELSSVFESLGFSGVAYLIACGYGVKRFSKSTVQPVEDLAHQTSV